MSILMRPVPQSVVQKFIFAIALVFVALAMSSVALAVSVDGSTHVPSFGVKLVELFGETIMTVVGLGLTALIALLSAWLKGKIGTDKADALLRAVKDLAMTVVRDVWQTTVEALKEKSKDGKLSSAEINDIKSKALAKFKSYLTAKQLHLLIKAFGQSGVDGFLGMHIEAAIAQNKSASVQLDNKQMILPS